MTHVMTLDLLAAQLTASPKSPYHCGAAAALSPAAPVSPSPSTTGPSPRHAAAATAAPAMSVVTAVAIVATPAAGKLSADAMSLDMPRRSAGLVSADMSLVSPACSPCGAAAKHASSPILSPVSPASESASESPSVAPAAVPEPTAPTMTVTAAAATTPSTTPSTTATPTTPTSLSALPPLPTLQPASTPPRSRRRSSIVVAAVACFSAAAAATSSVAQRMASVTHSHASASAAASPTATAAAGVHDAAAGSPLAAKPAGRKARFGRGLGLRLPLAALKGRSSSDHGPPSAATPAAAAAAAAPAQASTLLATPRLTMAPCGSEANAANPDIYVTGPRAILPGLYLGSAANATDQAHLATLGVSFVVNVAKELGPGGDGEHAAAIAAAVGQNAHETLHVPWTHAGPLEPSLTATLDALHRAHATEGRTVLVHCAQGVSRSATLVVAYVMLKENWPWARAYAYVKSRSESVCPNVGLVGEVLAWDAERRESPAAGPAAGPAAVTAAGPAAVHATPLEP